MMSKRIAKLANEQHECTLHGLVAIRVKMIGDLLPTGSSADPRFFAVSVSKSSRFAHYLRI